MPLGVMVAGLLMATQQPAKGADFPAEFGDVAIGDALRSDGEDGPPTALDKLTINQMMRLATLSQERLRESRCAGLARWQAGQKGPSKKAGATRFHAAVVAALASDAELPADLAEGVVNAFGAQIDYKKKSTTRQEFEAFFAQKVSECSDLLAIANRNELPPLQTLVDRSIVDPGLANCFALYTIAADAAEGEEADALRRDAAVARGKAVAGKDAEAIAAADAKLAEELASARAQPESANNAESAMMRLVMCQPLLRGDSVDSTRK